MLVKQKEGLKERTVEVAERTYMLRVRILYICSCSTALVYRSLQILKLFMFSSVETATSTTSRAEADPTGST